MSSSQGTQPAEIVITAEDPLIISSSWAATTLGSVTIEGGGYILITTAAGFSCTSMEAIPGGESPVAYTITVAGEAGGDGANGKDGDDGNDGDDGDDGNSPPHTRSLHEERRQ